MAVLCGLDYGVAGHVSQTNVASAAFVGWSRRGRSWLIRRHAA